MQRTIMLMGTMAVIVATGCDAPRPASVPPASVPSNVSEPDDVNVNIDTGGPRGVDVNVDVTPESGGPAVDVDIDRRPVPTAGEPR